MVELGECVDEEFPVAADFGAVAVDLGHFVEGVAFDALEHGAEVFLEALLGVEVDEDEALPGFAGDFDESVVLLVDVEEFAFLLDEGEFAVEVVAPGVVFAGELAAGA